MTGIGVHFALTSEQAEALVRADDPDGVMALIDELEEGADEVDHVASDKAWDAIHRCLSDGALQPGGGAYPLSHAVLGGNELDAGEDCFVSHLTSEQVRDVAEALAPLDEPWFRQRFFALDPADYDGPGDGDDFAYTWANFIDVRTFYGHAARVGRPVVFTVDR